MRPIVVVIIMTGMPSFFGKLFGKGDAESGDWLRPGGAPSIFRGYQTASGADPRTGREIFRSGAATSGTSQDDADRQARLSAQHHVEMALRGAEKPLDTYAYQVDRRVEPLYETLERPPHPPTSITVNGYGALVMNAPDALFVDVDSETAADDLAAEALARLLDHERDLAFRVYRTHSGWRYLCTSRAFAPDDPATDALLETLHCDPKYRLLCRIQKCFRARLTPKPWRAGQWSLTFNKSKGLSRKSLEHHLDRTKGFATARFVSAAGSGRLLPELQPVIDYHDHWTRADSAHPLA